MCLIIVLEQENSPKWVPGSMRPFMSSQNSPAKGGFESCKTVPTCPTMSLQMRVMAMTSHSIQNDSANSRGMIMLLDVACIYDRVRDLLLRYNMV